MRGVELRAWLVHGAPVYLMKLVAVQVKADKKFVKVCHTAFISVTLAEKFPATC